MHPVVRMTFATSLRRAMILVLALAIPTESVAADLVQCRDGKRYTGSIADRDRLRTKPASVMTVSILPDSVGESSNGIKRIARADIEFVILDDGGAQRQVIDMSSLPMPKMTLGDRGMYVSTAERAPNPSMRGEVLAGLGLAVFVVGLVVKLGPEEGYVTNSGSFSTRNTYSGTNYVLMFGGCSMVVGGVSWAVLARKSSAAWNEGKSMPALALSIHF